MDLQLRDAGGRWQPGQSGNPRGRPRGAKDRGPRRRGPLSAPESEREWRLYYRRKFQEAQGGPLEKACAAFAASVVLWLSTNPPQQRLGLCAYCHKELHTSQPSIRNAPVHLDSAWLHWCCVPSFLHARWNTATAAIQKLGLSADGPASWGALSPSS
jgi:hypothetical protein